MKPFYTNKRGLSKTIRRAYQWILSNKREDGWGLTKSSPSDIKSMCHVFMVFAQTNTLKFYKKEVLALCNAQKNDGSWGIYVDSLSGGNIGVTALAVRLLLYAKQHVRNLKLENSIIKGINCLLRSQETEGNWQKYSSSADGEEIDSYLQSITVTRGEIDITCGPLRTLYMAWKSGYLTKSTENAYMRGVDWLLQLQHRDGSWAEFHKKRSRVASTADALRVIVKVHEIRPQSVHSAVNFIIKSQQSKGFWDEGDIDHTADCVRALLMSFGIVDFNVLKNPVNRTVKWLLNIQNSDGGWGRYLGDESNVNDSCDVLSSLLLCKDYDRQDFIMY